MIKIEEDVGPRYRDDKKSNCGNCKLLVKMPSPQVWDGRCFHHLSWVNDQMWCPLWKRKQAESNIG